MMWSPHKNRSILCHRIYRVGENFSGDGTGSYTWITNFLNINLILSYVLVF